MLNSYFQAKRVETTCAASIALLTIMMAAPASAFTTTGSKWQEAQSSFHVQIGGADGLWNRAFESAMYEWSDQTNFDYLIYRDAADPCNDPNNSPAANGVGFSSSNCGASWGGNTLAVTKTYSLGGTITQTGMLFNSNFAWDVYSGLPRAHAVDFKRVALHELGHALGLGHEDSIPSIMHSYDDHPESLTSDDIAGVRAIYGGFGNSGDQHEPDNAVTTASFVQTGSTSHSIFPMTDEDWIAFHLDTPSSISIQTETLGDTVLELYYQSHDNLIESNDDTNYSSASSIELSCQDAGTYYARVTSYLQLSEIDNYSLTVETIPCGGSGSDTTPDAFSFTDLARVDLYTVQYSNIVTVQGVTESVPVSLTGEFTGSYSINGAPFDAAPSTVTNGDEIQVRHRSSSEHGTSSATMITIGTVSDTFTTTTMDQPIVNNGGESGGGGGGSLDMFSLGALAGLLMWGRRLQSNKEKNLGDIRQTNTLPCQGRRRAL